MTVSSAEELSVLSTVAEALDGLDEAAARRIVSWLADRYGVSAGNPTQKATSLARIHEPRALSSATAASDLASLYAAAQPKSDKEAALVCGYWFQVIKGLADLDGQAINRELKNLGHGVSNITKALSYLIEQRPQLAIQTRKSGNSQQARKKYRLTHAGVDVVEAMIARTGAMQ